MLMRKETRYPQAPAWVADKVDVGPALSKSPRMRAMLDLVQGLASTTMPVLIEGERGTGKGQLAIILHELAAEWRSGPLVCLDVSTLAASELCAEIDDFGAIAPVAGDASCLRDANQGTLLLERVDRLDASGQAALLSVMRALKESIGRDGFDVRVIAISERSLDRLVKQGRFSDSLYRLLSEVRIEVPPLRDRTEDIPLLAAHYAVRHAPAGEPAKTLSPASVDQLLRHPWPGNVQELERTVQRASLAARGPHIEPQDLALGAAVRRSGTISRVVDLSRPLPELLRGVSQEFEKKYLLRALEKTRGNIGRCARLCGLSRRSISAKLAEYGIDKREFKHNES